MAASKEGSIVSPQLIEIEQLKYKCNTNEAVYNGVMAAEQWKPGKQITEDAYSAAVEKFLNQPISGKEVKSNA
ncbi:hypothetical protein [Paenibacillus apiarius]|uniref:hypothetical protein n=1 Tax=Paenibacillus apiarius TaxID=46240 RepID=UPI003B3A22BF